MSIDELLLMMLKIAGVIGLFILIVFLMFVLVSAVTTTMDMIEANKKKRSENK